MPTRDSLPLPSTPTPLSYDLLSPGLDASIKRMKSLSVDTVALVFYHFQDNDTSTEIFLDYNRYSADPTALAAAVRLIHANGLKVLLKPHIGLNNNQFRGIIQPTAAYLAAYRAHILEWSAWATTHAVDVMCVGAELKGLEPAADFWRTLVADVRGLYQGPVTYGTEACGEGTVLGISIRVFTSLGWVGDWVEVAKGGGTLAELQLLLYGTPLELSYCAVGALPGRLYRSVDCRSLADMTCSNRSHLLSLPRVAAPPPLPCSRQLGLVPDHHLERHTGFHRH